MLYLFYLPTISFSLSQFYLIYTSFLKFCFIYLLPFTSTAPLFSWFISPMFLFIYMCCSLLLLPHFELIFILLNLSIYLIPLIFIISFLFSTCGLKFLHTAHSFYYVIFIWFIFLCSSIFH